MNYNSTMLYVCLRVHDVCIAAIKQQKYVTDRGKFSHGANFRGFRG